jgi:hypothetical protein
MVSERVEDFAADAGRTSPFRVLRGLGMKGWKWSYEFNWLRKDPAEFTPEKEEKIGKMIYISHVAHVYGKPEGPADFRAHVLSLGL